MEKLLKITEIISLPKERIVSKQSKFQILISVESYDGKTAENYRNYYVAEKRIVSKLSNVNGTN